MRNAVDEAKGKRMIALGYAAFVGIPICVVIALAVWKFGGDSGASNPSDSAQAPTPDSTGKKSDPQPKRIGPRPPRKTPIESKEPDAGTPVENEKKSEIKPPPRTENPEPFSGIATAPEPHPADHASEVAVVPMPAIIGIAPEPRAVRPVMAAPAGFTSDWEKVGAAEVRIAGVAVTRVPITNADMQDVDSPVPVLAIWLEVRTTSKSRAVELRRWQDPLGEYCELLTLRTKAIERGRLGPGATLRTGLPYKQPVPPDGTPRQDILVFAAPVEGTGTLRLVLEAERIGETGKIRFAIPETAWKK